MMFVKNHRQGRGYNTSFMLNSTEHELLINFKIPTIVGILTFMSGKNSILGLSEPIKGEFMSGKNSILGLSEPIKAEVLNIYILKISHSTHLRMKNIQ